MASCNAEHSRVMIIAIYILVDVNNKYRLPTLRARIVCLEFTIHQNGRITMSDVGLDFILDFFTKNDLPGICAQYVFTLGSYTAERGNTVR